MRGRDDAAGFTATLETTSVAVATGSVGSVWLDVTAPTLPAGTKTNFNVTVTDGTNSWVVATSLTIENPLPTTFTISVTPYGQYGYNYLSGSAPSLRGKKGSLDLIRFKLVVGTMP